MQMISFASRTPLGLAVCVATLLALSLLARPARGQSPSTERFTGPTVDALAGTAGALRIRASPHTTSLMPPYIAFERDFQADFGVARPLERSEVVQHVNSEIAARWGDTRLYRWAQRGAAIYAQFQAWTEVERRGFEMEMEVDDVVDGKVGVRVARDLQ